MMKDNTRFVAAIVVGFVLMLLFGALSIRIQFIPLAGPFVGGLVAGLIAGKDYMNAAKAAIVAGLLGAIGVALDIMANTSYFRAEVPQFPQFAGFLFLLIAILYYPILALIGGVIGAAINPSTRTSTTTGKSD